MKNVVVKVKSAEHGENVIQAFKDLGVFKGFMSGNNVGSYYGLFHGEFTFSTSPHNSQVITLEELQAMANHYPNEMMVWDDDEECAVQREVLARIEHRGIITYVTFRRGRFYLWKHAKPIEEELTHEERIQRLEDELKKLKG
jgi:hypothetical protein